MPSWTLVAHGRMPAKFPTKQLERRLRRAIRGEARFDNGSRALYSTDSSNYRQIPIGVVIPRTEADVVETVTICRELGVPITSRGGGTSLAGQTGRRITPSRSSAEYSALAVRAAAL